MDELPADMARSESVQIRKKSKPRKPDLRERNAAKCYLLLVRSQLLEYLGLSFEATADASHSDGQLLVQFCRRVAREVKLLRHTDWYRNKRNNARGANGWGTLDCFVLSLYFQEHEVGALRVGDDMVPESVCFQALCVLLMRPPSLANASTLSANEALCFAFAMGALGNSSALFPGVMDSEGGSYEDEVTQFSRAGGQAKGDKYAKIREFIAGLIHEYPWFLDDQHSLTASAWAEMLRDRAVPAIAQKYKIDLSKGNRFYGQVRQTLNEIRGPRTRAKYRHFVNDVDGA